MSLAQFALRRPYTIIASLMLICIMGIGAGLRMPIDIFPEIDIPVVSVVWTYAGMSPQDIQNRILRLDERQLVPPSGGVKIAAKDYSLAMNSSPNAIAAISAFPVKAVAGQTIFIRDIAHVHDGYQIQTNSLSVDGGPGALISVRKTGGVSTLAVVDGVREALPGIRKLARPGVDIKAIFDQSVFVKASLDSVLVGGAMSAGLTAMMILLGCSTSFRASQPWRHFDSFAETESCSIDA